MKLHKEQQKGVTILRLQGDVMGSPEAVQIMDEINHLLDSRSLKVVIDLAQVQRMNSSGLGILIDALTTFKQNGGELKLASTTPLVQNLMKMTRLDSLFESYDTVDAAVASF